MHSPVKATHCVLVLDLSPMEKGTFRTGSGLSHSRAILTDSDQQLLSAAYMTELRQSSVRDEERQGPNRPIFYLSWYLMCLMFNVPHSALAEFELTFYLRVGDITAHGTVGELWRWK